MTEDELIFVSNNYKKLAEVQELLKDLDVTVVCRNYNFKELKDEELFLITADKAITAYNDLEKPLIVMDTGFYVKNYPDSPWFPGTFIKTNLLDTIGIPGLLEKMKDVKDRECCIKECLVYYDGDNFKSFESRQNGVLSEKDYEDATTDKFSSLYGIFIPYACNKTVSQMTKEEKRELGNINPNVFSLFSKWYKKERNKSLVKKIPN